MTTILKVVVGSRAHGLATPESDYDYRGVYVTPTREILSSFELKKPTGTHWNEGEKEDATEYELGHFLHLATHSNPTILEVFGAPIVDIDEFGCELRDLFPHVWSSKYVLDAFVGYSHNQRTKFFKHDMDPIRKKKFAVAYIRVLFQGVHLLRTGEMLIKVPSPMKEDLQAIRRGDEEWTMGRIVDMAETLKLDIQKEYDNNPGKETNLEPLKEFLLKVRKEMW